MINNLENNFILKEIIKKELPSLNLSRREERILRKRREGMLLLDIAKAEKPSLTRERVRQILLEANKKEQERDKILKRVISKINQYFKEKNV